MVFVQRYDQRGALEQPTVARQVHRQQRKAVLRSRILQMHDIGFASVDERDELVQPPKFKPAQRLQLHPPAVFNPAVLRERLRTFAVNQHNICALRQRAGEMERVVGHTTGAVPRPTR